LKRFIGIGISFLLLFLALFGSTARGQISPARDIKWPTGATGCLYDPAANTCDAPGGGLTPLFGTANPTGAGGTPVYVQQNNGGIGGSGTLTVAFGSSVSSGDAIIVVANWDSGTISTPTDTLGTSFSSLALNTTTESNTNIYCGIVPSSGSDTVTFNGINNAQGGIIEVSGMLCTVDATGSQVSGSSGTLTPSVTTTDANDFLLSYVNNATTAPKASSVASPWTAVSGSPGSPGGIYQFYTLNLGYEVSSTAGSYSPTWTVSNSITSAAQVIAFEAGGTPVSGTEGQLYFQTGSSPYNGFVYHSSAWQSFN
jgi:hypothetical protein